MIPAARLQLIGPIVLFVVVAAAEGAAAALAQWPFSEALWYANLNIFSLFQRAHYVLGDLVGVAHFQFLGIAAPLLLIACAGLMLRLRLLLAIASNGGLVYVMFLAYSWLTCEGSTKEASLVIAAMPSSPGCFLWVGLVAPALLSTVVSHLGYVRAVRGDAAWQGRKLALRSSWS